MAIALVASVVCSVLAAFSTGTASAAGNTGAPPLTILTPGANNSNGDIFLAPYRGSYPSGPEIITNTGRVVWFHALPTGDTAYDFRTQTYLGHPVLTWYQNGGPGGRGGIIYNDRFQQIATVHAGNGYSMDLHEFLLTPWNTALILAGGVTTANLTSIGGPADQKVGVNVVQEIDIRTGRVLFQWNAADHVPYSDSHQPLPSSPGQAWDWFHVNAVHLDTDGNLLVSSRNTWTVYKVNRHTGQVMWELGGKHSSFALRAAPGQVLDSVGEIFAWQHDPEALGLGLYTIFDDESGGELPYSRVVTVHLDPWTHTATLVKAVNQPEGLGAPYVGNAQTTRNGDLFVSWGGTRYISEFSRSGTLLFNAELPAGMITYRAYRLPWPPARCGLGCWVRMSTAGGGGRLPLTGHRVIHRGEAGLGGDLLRTVAVGRLPCPLSGTVSQLPCVPVAFIRCAASRHELGAVGGGHGRRVAHSEPCCNSSPRELLAATVGQRTL